MERRSGQRCPVCHGPTINDDNAIEGVRCRRSTCIFNHSEVRCVRCGAKDLSAVDYQDEHYHYTCGDCCHKWSQAKGLERPIIRQD